MVRFYNCQLCGAAYEAYSTKSLFCSGAHRAQHSRDVALARRRVEAHSILLAMTEATLARQLAVINGDAAGLRAADRALVAVDDRHEVLFDDPVRRTTTRRAV